MYEVHSKSEEDKGLLFVSHDANAVMSLCDRAMYLEKGKTKAIDEPKTILSMYTKDIHEQMKDIGEKGMKNIDKEKGGGSIQDINEYKSRWQDYRLEAINKLNNKNIIEITRNDSDALNSENISTRQGKILETKIKIWDGENGETQIKGGK